MKRLGKILRRLFVVTTLILMLMFQIVSIMTLCLPQNSLNNEDASKVDDVIAEAREKVYEAYAAIVDAEASGGNITGLVDRINEALDLVRKTERVSEDDPE